MAGRQRGNGFGYQFVTWIWDYGRTGLSHGHYYEGDYNAAKQDFAVRSGLISKAQLFSEEELTELYRATGYQLENDPEIHREQFVHCKQSGQRSSTLSQMFRKSWSRSKIWDNR